MAVDQVPYREGDDPPSLRHVRGRMVDENGIAYEVWVDPTTLRQAPIRHNDIDEFLPLIRWQWRHLGKYLNFCNSFEAWELGYLRDGEPEREIALFTRATYAFLEYPEVNRSKLVGSLIHLLNGRSDLVTPRKVAKELVKLLMTPPAALADLTNFTEDGELEGGPEYLR